jgi:parvulin-like peptidyl-prolyl isomerase
VSSYAARVNGSTIPSQELEDELRSIASNEHYLKVVQEGQNVQVLGSGPGTFTSAFSALALTRQIYYRLIEAELRRRKIVVRPADLDAARSTVVNQLEGDAVFASFPKSYQAELIRREAELDLLTLSIHDAPSTDVAARRLYDQHPELFYSACVRHILVPTQDAAEAVKRRLDAGEDFAKVAQAESKDPGSASGGGLVGCEITPDSSLVPEFLSAVATQPVGVVGPPVRSQFGFHLIKVDSRVTPPFDQVRDVAAFRLESKVREVLRTLVQKARIDVNPRFGTFTKDDANPRVKPPAAPVTTLPAASPGPTEVTGGQQPTGE